MLGAKKWKKYTTKTPIKGSRTAVLIPDFKEKKTIRYAQGDST